MGVKRVNSFLCLLGLLIWMDGGRTSPSVRVYNLPSLVDDLRIVAGVVTGVAVAHQIQNGSLGKDELVGEMCLGPNRKMSSLAAVNASELSMDLGEIGRIVTDECGDKCDSVADDIIESGNKVLEVFNLLLTDDQKSLLKDTDAFKNLKTLQDYFDPVLFAQQYSRAIRFLEISDLKNANEVIATLSKFKYNIAKIMELEPSIDYVEKHIMALVNQTARDILTKQIDTLLSLESNHPKIIEEMRLFKMLESQLTEFDKKAGFLWSVLTSETVDRIERTLERMLPIVTSSGRSSKHPLRLLVSDFDSTIEGFEKKFLENANSLSLKPFLKPIEKLIRDVKPLLTSWESEHFDEAVDDTINSFTMNLNISLSQITSFSAFISPLYQCIKDVVIDLRAYKFKYLKNFKNNLEFVEGDVLKLFEPFKTSFEGLHTARKLMEFSNRSETEIRGDFENIPNVTVAKEELRKFYYNLSAIVKSHIFVFGNDQTLEKVFSRLKLTPAVHALDCLQQDNVLSRPWDPIGIESFGSIKSGSAEVEAIISAAKAVERQSEEWKKNEKTTTTNSRRRRSRDESTTSWISDEMAKKFASGTKVVIDFGQVYEARDRLVTLSSLADTVNREVGALNDTKAQKRIAKVWNSDVQRMLAELPEAVAVLNRSLSKVPRSLVDFSTAFDFAQLLDFAKIDTRALRKALRFVSNGDVQKSLKTIGSLDLDFADSFRRLEGAREALTHMLISLRKLRKSVGMRGKRDTSHMSHLEDFQPERHPDRFSRKISKSIESTDEDDSDSEHSRKNVSASEKQVRPIEKLFQPPP